jgi:hypothetical protein
MAFFRNPEQQAARDIKAARVNLERLTTAVADGERKAAQRGREAQGLALEAATDAHSTRPKPHHGPPLID